MAPAEIGSAFVLDRTGRVREILCLQEERRVGNDNTVKWRGLSLQIPPSPRRAHFVRATVRVHDYPEAIWPSSTDRIGWPITTPRESRAMTPNWLQSRFGSRLVDLWTTLHVAHNPTGTSTTEAVN